MAFGNRLIMGIVIACSLGMLSSCAFPVRPGYDRKSGTYKRYRVAKKAPAKVDTTAVNPQEELVIEEKLAAASKTVSSKATDADSINVASTKKTNAKDTTSQVSKKQTAVAASDSTGNKEQKTSVEQIQKQDSTKSAAKIADSTITKQPAKKVEVATKVKKETKPAARPTNLEKYAKEWLGAKYVYGAASKKKTDCSGYVMQVYKGFYGISLDHNAQRIYDDGRGYSIRRTKLQEGDLVFFGNFWKISHVGIYLKGNRFIHASTSDGVVITSMDDKYWSSKYKGARRFK
ncbi:C40 family peptidase [Fibrobacter sp.]|uniref:C40 family peptidase n=1 Tax=Fibrobacter sp. TaxID=35828 RepID=UPI0025B92A05|nr:C40 family peptidase [Fibrobacter sp.]MBR3070553.1 C40 family peptidase [Fibrobacter sp.]